MNDELRSLTASSASKRPRRVRPRWYRVDHEGFLAIRKPTILCYSPPVNLDETDEFDRWLAEQIARDAYDLEMEIRSEESAWSKYLLEAGSLEPAVERELGPEPQPAHEDTILSRFWQWVLRLIP